MGNLQEKIGGIDVKKLDELARKFVKDFLGTKEIDARTIDLYGQETEILEYLRTRMQGHFDGVNAGVAVGLGKRKYSINVGSFIS